MKTVYFAEFESVESLSEGSKEKWFSCEGTAAFKTAKEREDFANRISYLMSHSYEKELNDIEYYKTKFGILID